VLRPPLGTQDRETKKAALSAALARLVGQGPGAQQPVRRRRRRSPDRGALAADTEKMALVMHMASLLHRARFWRQ